MCLGAGLLVGAGALGRFFAITASDDRRALEPTAFVEAVTIPVAPPTIAPTVDAPATTVAASTVAASTVAPAVTLPISPLAAQLPPHVSAIPTVDEVVAPTEIRIADLELWAPINPVGVEPDGQLEIPDETEVGWYRLGSSPGRPGSTVLAAHVTWNDTIGPFFELGQLEPGAEIELTLADGSLRRYEVVERAQYGKLMLPQHRIWTQEGAETLVLITCGGDFNREIRRFADNIVAYAVPVASTSPAMRPAPDDHRAGAR